MHYQTLFQLSQALHAKKISSTELTSLFLERIRRYQPSLNCFITVAEAHALEQAKAADLKLQTNDATALTGIPIAHKDIFCTQAVKTSCASQMLDNFIAPYDATVVKHLNQANMVTLGKTNMDEFAMGSSNETSYYGTVSNPWSLDYVPGGSSGGSAATVAAGLATAATGTDTGGSIRQPAALCGLTGIKPTYGRVSRYGMIAFASSLDQGGVLAHDAQDAAMLMNAIIGHDPKDSTSASQPTEDYTETLNTPLNGLKVGIADEYFKNPLDPEIAQYVHAAVELLGVQGASIIPIQLPKLTLSIPTYYVIASAECSSNLSRYDGVRFGYRCQHPADLKDLYQRSRGEGFGLEVKRRLLVGTYVLSSGYYDAYYLKAQKIRRLIRQDFDNAFKQVDVIISPTVPDVAFKKNERTNDPVKMYLSDLYTASVNLAGLPAVSIPVGFKNDLPIGMQLIGNLFKEGQILNVAHQYQQHTDWHLQHPEAFH